MSTISGSLQPPAAASSPSSMSWEGDKMFNIYIHDYCSKRGFTNTARELMNEAEIEPDSKPPINARQGLLFEWWSVFWVLFTAKSSGVGPDDAMTYVQQQAAQQRERVRAATNRAGPMPFSQPSPRAMNGHVVQNGIVGPGPGLMQNGSIPFSLMGSANGLGGPTLSGGQPQNPQNLMMNPSNIFPQSAAQRVNMQHQRIPSNPPLPYPSPGMNQSPNGIGGMSGSSPLTQPMLGQLTPSPHINQMQRQGQVMNSTFQGLRPSSRAETPGQQQGLPNEASPSLMNRQINSPRNMQMEASVAAELNKLGTINITMSKNEVGWANRDLHSLNLEEKARLIHVSHQRLQTMARRALFGNAAAGPSGLNQQIQIQPPQQPQQPQQSQQPQQPQQPQQLQANRTLKRGSATPPNASSPRNETSPPDRKKLRPSPSAPEPSQQPPMNAMFPPTGLQQQAGGGATRQNALNGVPPSASHPNASHPPPPNLGHNPNLAHLGQPMPGSVPQNVATPPMGSSTMNNMQGGNPQASQFNQQFRQATPKNSMGNAMHGVPGLGLGLSMQHHQMQQQQQQPQNNQVQSAATPSDLTKPPATPSSPGKVVQKDPAAPQQGQPATEAKAEPNLSMNDTSAGSQGQQLGMSGMPDFTTDLMQSAFDPYDPLLFTNPEGGDADGMNFERDFGNWFSTNADDVLMNAPTGI